MTNVSEKKDFESEKIWKEISNLPIDVYAVGNQIVSQHVTKIDLPANELYVKLGSTAVLPALEAVLANGHLTKGNKYEVLTAEGYVIVRRSEDHDQKVRNILAEMKRKAIQGK